MRPCIVLVAVAALASVAGPAWAQPQPVNPALSYQPDGASQDRTRVVFSFGVGGEPARRVNVGLGQAASLQSVEAEGTSDCVPSQISGRPVATCTYGTPLPENSMSRVTMVLSDAYPQNGGGLIQLAGDGGSGPLVDVPGPVEGEAADLHASVIIAGNALWDLRQGHFPDTILPIAYRADNFGPDAARDIRITTSSSAGRGIERRSPALPMPSHLCREERETFQCGNAPADGIRSGTLYYEVTGPGSFLFSMSVSSLTPDPGPHPNSATLEVEVTLLPDTRRLKFTGRDPSRPGAARAGPTISGRATNARSVYIALARRIDGARVQTSAAGCAWLRNSRGTLRREPGRLCDEPIWVKARGRTSWRLNIRRPLPPGSYTVLSRAVAASGVIEGAFSRRDGNRIEARIRR